MDCSCEDEVKPAKMFIEENGDLINETDMYKHHLDDRQKIRCSSYGKYWKKLWKNYVELNSQQECSN